MLFKIYILICFWWFKLPSSFFLTTVDQIWKTFATFSKITSIKQDLERKRTTNEETWERGCVCSVVLLEVEKMAEKLKVTLPRSRSPKLCYQDHTSQLLTMLAIHIWLILLIFIYLFFVVLLFYWLSSLRKQPSFRNATLNNVWKTTEKTTAEIPYWWLHYPDLGRAHDWLICLIQSEELTRCGQYQVHLKNFPRPIFYEKRKTS